MKWLIHCLISLQKITQYYWGLQHCKIQSSWKKYQILHYSSQVKFFHLLRKTDQWNKISTGFTVNNLWFVFHHCQSDGWNNQFETKFIIAILLRIFFHWVSISSFLCLLFANKFLSPLTEEASWNYMWQKYIFVEKEKSRTPGFDFHMLLIK